MWRGWFCWIARRLILGCHCLLLCMTWFCRQWLFPSWLDVCWRCLKTFGWLCHFFLSYFCISNVIDIQLENSRCRLLCFTSFLSLKKQRLQRQRMSVSLFLAWVTFRYLQDCMAKSIATVVSCPLACCYSVFFRFAIFAMTQMGIAFCCFCFGSSLTLNWYCCCRRKEDWRSLSLDGLGRPCSRKVKNILEMVFLTVPAARFFLKASLKKCPSLMAVAKAQMRRFCWHLLNLSRKGLWARPINLQYSIHCLWDWAWSSCVAPVNALSRAVAAAMMSATILFCWGKLRGAV